LHGHALKAFCDIAIGDWLLIRGIRVIDGKDGLFVSMPRQQSGNGKWYDSVVLRSQTVRQAIAQAVLAEFHREVTNASL
jgi:stage V sporulation protein G